MAAKIVEICDDIRTLIGGATLSTSLGLVLVPPSPGGWLNNPTLFKGYLAEYALEDLDQTRVSVLPATYESESFSRNSQLSTYGIDVVAQVRPVDEAGSDAIYKLTEEISVLLQYRILSTSGARWSSMEPASLVRGDELQELRIMTVSTRHIWIV